MNSPERSATGGGDFAKSAKETVCEFTCAVLIRSNPGSKNRKREARPSQRLQSSDDVRHERLCAAALQ